MTDINYASDHYICPNCALMIASLQRSSAIHDLPCNRCGKYNWSEFIPESWDGWKINDWAENGVPHLKNSETNDEK